MKFKMVGWLLNGRDVERDELLNSYIRIARLEEI